MNWNTTRRRPACRLALLVVLVCGLMATTMPANAQGAGYWHTSGNQIFDANNQPVRIAGINWYGFETPDRIIHGLWAQDYKAILNTVKNNGYNVVRIAFSNEMVESNPIPSNFSLTNATGPINRDLSGLTALQILDKIITFAGNIGLRVILDNHRSEAGETAEANGLWYTSAFPESAWINDWIALSKRYLNNPTVIGMDLRNEPHTANNSGACWGCGTVNDWRLAAQRAGNAVLGVNPHLLIFVEGTDCFNGDCDWWGGNLEGVAQFPVVLSVPNQLVYSPHEYGPNLFQQTWFNSTTTPASLQAVWTKFWGYIYLNKIAPIWVGEFGTPNNATDIQNTAAGSQGQWFGNLVQFIGANKWMGWSYWALNGEDPYPLLDNGYDSAPLSPLKQQLLAANQFPLTGGVAPPPPGTFACHVTYTITGQWGTGFQVSTTIANTGTLDVSSWNLKWTFPGSQQISNLWNGSFTQTGAAVSVTNANFNGSILAGGSQSGPGFVANGPSATPASFSVNGTACQ